MADANGTSEAEVIGKLSPDIGTSANDQPNQESVKGGCVDRYSSFVAARPLTTCLAAHLLVFIICLIPILCFMGDLVEIDFSLGSMQVRGNIISDRKYAVEAAECGGQCFEWDRRLGRGDHDEHEDHHEPEWRLTLAYVSKDEENVLSESRLKQALSLERDVANILGREPVHTELPKFFPSYPADSGVLGGAALQSKLVAVAEHVTDTRHQNNFMWPHYDMNFSSCTPKSQLISSVFENIWDFDIFQNELSDLETDDVYATFFWTAYSWTDDEFWFPQQRDDQIGKDTLLIIGVLISAVIIIGLQTRSFFIAIAGLLSILFATGVAFVLYRTLVSKWFGVLNAFSVFLLLGIACDDIFVVSDAWRQAVETMGISPDDYHGRVRYVVTHSFMSITTTSLTTAGAFFGNAISKIPPLRLFGVFSGFMVLADWLLTLLVLPAVLVLQHYFFGNCKCGSQGGADNSPRRIDKFLTQSFAPRVFKIAPALILFFAVVVATTLNIALEMPPGAAFHESDLFPTGHVQARAYRAQQAMRDLEPEYAHLQIVHGVKPEDNGDMNNPQSKPEAVWDNGLDVYDAEVQQFIHDLCTDLLAQRGMVRRLEECWASDVKSELARRSLPFPAQSRFHSNQGLGSAAGIRSVGPWGSQFWTRISVQTTLFHDAPVSEIRSHYDRWEAWMQNWNEEARRRGLSGVANGLHTAERWHFMSTIEEYSTSCIAAACISTGIVAVLLLLTLRNIIVVFLVLINVIGVCLTLLAIFVIEGRKLGVLEGIAMTLLVGLSVDYLVHVGKAYLDEPEDESRERRTLNALSHLGGAVLAGSMTTVVSAIFLCFGTITFFVTFGTFVITMILLALVFTLLSLSSSLYLFGPEKNFSTIPCPQRCCKVAAADAAALRQVNVLTDGLEVKPYSTRTRLVVGVIAALVLVAGGAIRLGLSLRSDDEEATACPTPSQLEFTFENYAIPTDQDTYRCRDFDVIPSGCTYWVTEFEPIITEGYEGTVHHMILFSTEGKTSTCPYTCFDMPNVRGLDAAWAVGMTSLKWPEGMAYAIGGYNQALQMHYYNHEQKSGLVDVRSGVRLKLTSAPPATTIGHMMIGLHPLGRLSIPAYRANVTRYADCTPRLRGNITVLAYVTHAHKIGFSVLTEVRRLKANPENSGMFTSTVVGDVGSDPAFNFDYQQVKMFPSGQERHLAPGDTVRVYCSYNSLNRPWQTEAGYGSEEEMCMTVIFAYPAENMESAMCLTDYSYGL